jgi:uncharacterized protein with PhoU and TrkA domain
MTTRDRIEHHVLGLKDTSEMMVDLALSSVIYYNEELAEEVQLLEDYADELQERVQRDAIDGAVQNLLNPDQALALVQLSEAAETIADAGREIADVVLRDVEPHPVLAQSVEDSDVVIARVEVHADAQLAGRALGEERVKSETGMHVFAIRREGKWIPGPEASDIVEPGDVLLASGPEMGRGKLEEVCQTDAEAGEAPGD